MLNSCKAFLRANGKSTKYNVDEFLEFVVSVAEDQADLDVISNYFYLFLKILSLFGH